MASRKGRRAKKSRALKTKSRLTAQQRARQILLHEAKRQAARSRKYAAARKRRALRDRKRDRVERRERAALNVRERARVVRQYVRGFDADDGFDMRRPKELTPAQVKKIERTYKLLAPMVLKPHIKVQARTKRQLDALTEFQRIEKKPRGMKAVPIVTPTPENTVVTVDDSGVVRMRRGRVMQEFYFIPEELEDEPRADLIAKEMLKTMPKGRYFALTGEHEAYTEGVLHDPDDPAAENLALRLVRRWVGKYGSERVAKFFRGFRFIALADSAGREKAFKETERFRQRRKLLDKARAARRHEIGTVSRRRARRQIKR